MKQCADDVEVGVAVGDHHAFGIRRGAARVVDRDQIALVDDSRNERRLRSREQLLIGQPSFDSHAAFERDEMRHRGKVGADTIDRLQIVTVRAHDGRAGVIDDVAEIVRREPIVDRHDDGADLRHAVERFEHRMGVRRDIRDARAGVDVELLQHSGPAVAAIEELLVGETQRAVNDRFVMRVDAPGAPGELERRQWNFHDSLPTRIFL